MRTWITLPLSHAFVHMQDKLDQMNQMTRTVLQTQDSKSKFHPWLSGLSTLPLGHEGSPQYWFFLQQMKKSILFLRNLIMGNEPWTGRRPSTGSMLVDRLLRWPNIGSLWCSMLKRNDALCHVCAYRPDWAMGWVKRHCKLPKFKAWGSEAKHSTSHLQGPPAMLSVTSERGRNNVVLWNLITVIVGL